MLLVQFYTILFVDYNSLLNYPSLKSKLGHNRVWKEIIPYSDFSLYSSIWIESFLKWFNYFRKSTALQPLMRLLNLRRQSQILAISLNAISRNYNTNICPALWENNIRDKYGCSMGNSNIIIWPTFGSGFVAIYEPHITHTWWIWPLSCQYYAHTMGNVI